MADKDYTARQIRDGTYTVNTPSLTELGNEPVPDEIIRDLLVQEWVETEQSPRPLVVVKNERKQADLARSDGIAVSVTDATDEPLGYRHEHVIHEVPVLLEINTVHSRQRLWNLMGECRRIVYKWMLALRPYHCLYWDRFVPDYEARAGYYSGTAYLRLTADAWPVFQRATEGMESPNIAPEDET